MHTQDLWKYQTKHGCQLPELSEQFFTLPFVGLAYQGKDIVFRFIIEYSSLMDFGPEVVGLFL
jgi:hypothetical protein